MQDFDLKEIIYNFKELWRMTSLEKILKTLDVAKASTIDQICSKFLKTVAPVTANLLINIINMSIKRDRNAR